MANLNLFSSGGVASWSNDSNALPATAEFKAISTYYPHTGNNRVYLSFGWNIGGNPSPGYCVSASVDSSGALGSWVYGTGSYTSYCRGAALNTGEVMHLIGGIHTSTSDVTSSIYRFTLNSDGTVTALSNQTFPVLLSDAGAVRIGNYAYVVGGLSWTYDSGTDSWSYSNTTTIYRAAVNGDDTVGTFTLYSSGAPVLMGNTSCTFVGDPLSPVGGRLVIFCEVSGEAYYDAILSLPVTDTSGNLGSWRVDQTNTGRGEPELRSTPHFVSETESGKMALLISDGNQYLQYEVDSSYNISALVSSGYAYSASVFGSNLILTQDSSGNNFAHCAGGRDVDWTTKYTATYSGQLVLSSSGIICRSSTPDISASIARALAVSPQAPSATPSTIAASLSRSLKVSSILPSTTPSISSLVRRAITLATQQPTSSPNVAGGVLRQLKATPAIASVTPSISAIITRALSVSIYGNSITSDVLADVSLGFRIAVAQGTASSDVAPAVERPLVASIPQTSSTPAVAASILRGLSFSVSGQSVTPEAYGTVLRPLLLSVEVLASTPDVEASRAISLSVFPSLESSTGSADVTLERSLVIGATQDSLTSDCSAETTRPISFSAIAESHTSDAYLSADLILKMSVVQGSVSPDVEAAITRSLTVAVDQPSATDGVEASAERWLSFSPSIESISGDADASVNRPLFISAESQSIAPDDVRYTIRDLGIIVDTSINLIPTIRAISPVDQGRTISLSTSERSISLSTNDRTLSVITGERSLSHI